MLKTNAEHKLSKEQKKYFSGHHQRITIREFDVIANNSIKYAYDVSHIGNYALIVNRVVCVPVPTHHVRRFKETTGRYTGGSCSILKQSIYIYVVLKGPKKGLIFC